jgi:hypothetical protein
LTPATIRRHFFWLLNNTLNPLVGSLIAPQVAPAGLLSGPFGRTCSRVFRQHVRARPADYRHQTTLGAARGQPAMRRGTPQVVRMKASNTSATRAPAERLV